MKNMKQEELSLRETFELSLRDHELILHKKKRREDIEHKIIVDEEILEICDDNK